MGRRVGFHRPTRRPWDVLYKRYIDDIFIIWKGDRNQLISFFEKLNANHKNINKKPTSKVNLVPVVLEYNAQYKKIEKIFARHWHILKSDSGLREVLPDRPMFIYKRNPTLRDQLVKSVIDPPKNSSLSLRVKDFFHARDAILAPIPNYRMRKSPPFSLTAKA